MSSAGPAREWFLALAIGALLILPAASGQTGPESNASNTRPDVLTIVSSSHSDIPVDRARVLLLTTCRVVAEEFHRKPEDAELQLTLIIGEGDERTAVDAAGHEELYLKRWDEGKFVDGVITGATQMLTSLHTRRKMFSEILNRADRIAPIAANQLRATGAHSKPNRLPPDCISAVRETPCSWLHKIPY